MTDLARAGDTIAPPLPAFAAAKANETTTRLHFAASGGSAVESRTRAHEDGSAHVVASKDGTPVAEAAVSVRDGETLLDIARPDISHPDTAPLIAALIDAAFQQSPQASRLLLADPAAAAGLAALATGAIEAPQSGERRGVVERSIFYQLPLLWRTENAHVAYPAARSSLGPKDRLPVLRPPRPVGVMYRRWLPQLGLTLSFRPIDRRRDLSLFHEWMNQKRVEFFWELGQSVAELDAYLAAQEADPHIFGVIGSFDDEPVGYFEFYWAKEDRLGPHYDAEDFDRGWHGLIGNARHLGRPKTLAWFRSLTHYLFLDDPRTQRIVGEPRASHHKMLSYCADVAYDKVKEFDFPHKRAMLVCCERERFFREVPL